MLPESPAAWTALGLALHETFCEWEKADRQIDTCEYFLNSYDQYIAEFKERQPDLNLWQRPPRTNSTLKHIDSCRQRGIERDVPEYTQRCMEAEWEIYRFEDGTKALELEYEIELNGVAVKCVIDRIQWWPNRGYATIEDLKSGNVDDQEYDRRQLGLYAYAATTVDDIPLKYGRYWFTKVDRGSEWFDLSRYDYNYLSDTFVKLDSAINQKIFLPNPGKHCQMCQVQRFCPEQGNEDINEQR